MSAFVLERARELPTPPRSTPMATPDRDILTDGLVRIGEDAVAKSNTHCSMTTTPTTTGYIAPPATSIAKRSAPISPR
jgi:hypothetical protein